MKRRDVLQSLGALPVVSLAPATAMPSAGQDPVVALYGEIVAARAEWRAMAALRAPADADSPECEAAERREFAARNALAELRPCTPEGLAAALHVVWLELGPMFTPGTAAFDEAMARTPEYRLLWSIGQEAARQAGTAWNPAELYGP